MVRVLGAIRAAACKLLPLVLLVGVDPVLELVPAVTWLVAEVEAELDDCDGSK